MHAESIKQCAQGRRIGLHLTSGSLAPRVLEALRTLDYELEECEIVDRAALEDRRVWLVDADRLVDFPDLDAMPDARLLLITPPDPEQEIDSRAFAHTTRPGRLGPVYAMIQRALEQHPRSTPRIPTQLSARCIRADRRSIGAVLSLSEGGCLLRTSDSLRKGMSLDLQFALPDYGLISTPAECRYTRRGNAGLAFASPTSDIRHSIAHYVTLQLATNADLAMDESLRGARSA